MSTAKSQVYVTLAPNIEDLIRRAAVEPTTENTRPQNARKGGRQTVYPFKDVSDIRAIGAVLASDDNRYWARNLLAFTLGVNLGLRANELLQLRVRDVFFQDGRVKYIESPKNTTDGIVINESKTKKKRTIYLNAVCRDMLEWYFADRDEAFIRKYVCSGEPYYLFPSRKGSFIEVGTFRDLIKDAATKVGVEQNVGSHSCRKSFAYHHYEAGAVVQPHDIAQLQRLLGHSSASITLRYIGITDEEDKAMYHNVQLETLTPEDKQRVFSSSVNESTKMLYA